MPYTVLYNPTSGSGIDAAGEVGYLMHADTLDYVDIIRHGHSVAVLEGRETEVEFARPFFGFSFVCQCETVPLVKKYKAVSGGGAL